MSVKDKLIVALDVDTMEEVESLTGLLRDEVGMFKIGMQLYNSLGREVVSRVREGGGRVFLDLKLHDIPNTVGQAVRVLTSLGADIINVHASGGRPMMEAAAEAAAAEADRLGIARPLVIAVTILTSLGDEDLSEIGYRSGPADMVKRLAMLSKKAGLDGVVCSPQEASLVRQVCGEQFITVTPGVRPASAAVGDQKRIMTPGRAIEAGSHYLVVGRPITAAEDPVQAARDIVREMEEALC